MIPQELEQKIVRLHFVEKWRVSTIARQVGVHHTTVQRVLRDHGQLQTTLLRPSMVDPYLPFIEQILAEYPTLPASRLHAMIAERGYPGGPDHFRRLVSRLRPRKPAEAYQRLRTLVGEEGQMDWGHFGNVQIGRGTRALSAFVMVLSWSRKPFVRFFFDQRMGSFLTGHVAAFEAFGGVPRRVLYDNLKSAVLERRADAIRFNPRLLELAGHYRYEPRPVAVARGNEKGRVERTIRYLRTSFWPGRSFKNIEELNAQAAQWCDGIASHRKCPGDPEMTVHEAWCEERGKLLALPDDAFSTVERVEVSVGKQPYARFDRNDYTVPHTLVRRTLVVLATPTTVRIVDGTDIVAEHVRSFAKGEQIEEPSHLADLTAMKREARQQRGMDRLHYRVPLSSTLLERAARRGHNIGSAVAGLLRLVDSWGGEAVEEAISEALDADMPHVAAVRQVLERQRQQSGEGPSMPVELPDDPRVRQLAVRPHSLNTYDAFGGSDVPDNE